MAKENFNNMMKEIEEEMTAEFGVKADKEVFDLYPSNDVPEYYEEGFIKLQWALVLGTKFNGPTII